jgi:putative nucleotidyltransferase with HDIG domain
MANGVDNAPENKASKNEASEDEISQAEKKIMQNEASGNGALEQPAVSPPASVSSASTASPKGGSLGRKPEEFHRPPTRMERLRAWLERQPRVRLYVTLLLIVWLSLTLLIGVDVRPNTPGGLSPWTVFLGVGIVVATEMWIAWYFLERFGKKILRKNALIRILLAASLLVLFTALARAFVLLSLPPYLIPLAGLSIIGTILLGPRLMFVMVVIAGVNVGIIAGNDFFLTASLLITSGFAIYTVLRVGPRMELLRAGLLIALVSAIVNFAVTLIGAFGFRTALEQGGIGLANGLLSLMLAMVLLPLLENAFNILTPMKLLELSDPGNPLLQKLLRGAPGTFSHAMQVGNLAENAAERIGADPLLARVGSYYHDVGKLEHPNYFVENQISRMNPHATLTPALSARIIKRHVKDGVELGRQWNLPAEVIDMIREHHGTTRIEYFYRKALEEAIATGASVSESDFRYPGPRPKSKEAGILMLADSIEATVKSLERPTPKRIEDIVNGTIRGKLEDSQFDECELTMREIHETGEAIQEALIGFIGPRIEYPEATAERARSTKNPTP